MLPALFVFLYLGVVLYVGIFAFRRRGAEGKEDFFLANRGLGTFVFLLSLFGSNMTAFAILGSSGLAFRMGIGVYGLMASISGIIIPLSLFLIGTRLWAIGKRFGHITQVQILRDRFEMGHIGTVVFALEAVMLVPYIIIGVMGGGETLEGVSDGAVPYWFGGLIVALVVMSYVFFGGMRGTAWVNTLQTLMFLTFGTIAFYVIARGLGGLGEATGAMLKDLPPDRYAQPSAFSTSTTPAPPLPTLLTRERLPFWYFASYLFIPLSSIMFPHIAIFCLTAKKVTSFKKTVVLYPLCIMALWLPAVFLGALAGGQGRVVADLAMTSAEAEAWLHPAANAAPVDGAAVRESRLAGILTKLGATDPAAAALLADVRSGAAFPADQPTHLAREAVARRLLAIAKAEPKPPTLLPELRRLAATNADGVMLRLLDLFAPLALAGILGAAIMACVMASDSQILALSTMFSEDIFAYYGARERWGEKAQVWSARVFVIILGGLAYLIALAVHEYASIFEVAIQYAFSGYASLAPIMLACLFWRRATKWGVLASTVWVALCLAGSAVLQAVTAAPKNPAVPEVIWRVGDVVVLLREPVRISFTEHRLLLVVPMIAGAALLLWLVSLCTRPPSAATVARYFPPTQA